MDHDLVDRRAFAGLLHDASPGQWAPVYLEPMPGSGERLTVAVVALGSDGFHLVRTLPEMKAKCMYGTHAVSMLGMIDLIVESLDSHLRSTARLEGWRPPLRDTVSLGTIRASYGATVEDVAKAGAKLCASLSISGAEEPQTKVAAAAPQTLDNWVQQIRNETISVRHDFRDRFGCRVALHDGAPKTTIGYFGSRLAAQFGRLTPGASLTKLRNRAKAYAADLQMLRESERNNIAPRSFYELMLWVPDSQSADFTSSDRDDAQGAFNELAVFYSRHGIQVEAVTGSRQAVERILHVEEAA